MIAYIRSALFWAGFMLSSIVVTFLLVLMFPFPFRVRQSFSKSWPLFNIWWLRVTCALKHEVEGLENIPDGAAIYMCKHQSTWETLVMESIVPPMVWVLKRELMWIPIFGWGLAMLKPIAIDRSKGRKAAEHMLTQGARRLEEGISVVIFPEGTRVAPGERGRYRPGAALLAVKTRTPVIPMAHNAGYYWPRHGFLKRPGTIRMVIGPAIDTHGMSASKINQAVENWIETKVEEIGGPDSGPNVSDGTAMENR